MTTDTASNGNGSAQQSPSLNILAQYVKDLSFENPGAPRSLQARDNAPSININVNVNANPLAENDFDVVLSLNAEAKDGERVLFNVELPTAAFSVLPASRRNTCCRCCSSNARACCSRSRARSLPTRPATAASRR